MIGDRIDDNAEIEAEDFVCASLDQHGGLGKLHRLLSAGPSKVIEASNKELAV